MSTLADSFTEIKTAYLRNLDKQYDELSVVEKAVLADIVSDKMHSGRVSCLSNVNGDTLHEFLIWVRRVYEESYSELNDEKRWAAEDAYFENERRK